MFGLFKKKSEKELLYEKYQKLMQEANGLSTTNRKLSDDKTFKVEEVMKPMEKFD